MKAKLLIYRVSYGRLPTQYRLLFLQGISSTCCLRGDEDETLDHLFVGYIYLQGVWEELAKGTQCALASRKRCTILLGNGAGAVPLEEIEPFGG